MSASRENHIVCVGAVYIDTILTVPHFPVEDEKLRAKSITRRRGGNTANSLEVLSQLLAHDQTSMQPPGVTNLHLLAVLPNQQSPASNFISESLPAVNISGLSLFREDHQDAASSYIIQSEANRSRTIVSINELAEMQASEFTTQIRNAGAGWNSAWCHFEGRIPDVTHACVKFLRKEFPHFRLSVECEKPERREMAEVAKYADVVFYSKLWAQKNGYQDAESFLQAQISDKRDGTLLCCTWGSGGAVAVKKGGGDEAAWARVEAWQQTEESGEPTRVVDTIGAGDTFIAGMLFAVNNHEEWALQQKLEFANELAGKKVLQEGFGGLGAKMW